MLQSAADISAMYAAVGDLVIPAAGAPFHGLIGAADMQPFDAPHIAGDYELRYPATVALAVGALLTIHGVQYRVVEDPRRIEDGREMVVRLVAA